MKIIPKRNTGQALVVMLMVIALTVTIAGSAAFRTLSQTRQTKESEDAQKASNAARGIIDKILNNENVDTYTDFGAGNFNTRVTPVNKQNIIRSTYVTQLIPKDSQYMFYLQPYLFETNQFDGTPSALSGLGIHFLSSDATGCPVLEIIFISTGNAISRRAVTAACDASNEVTGNPTANIISVDTSTLSAVTDDGTSIDFSKSILIDTTTSDRMIIVRPLFDGTRLAFTDDVSLPPQGEIITSQAQSEGGAQSTQKVVRYYPQIPDFFFATSF